VEHFDVSVALQNLGVLYFTQGRYRDAKAVWTRALWIREQKLDPYDPRIAVSLNSLGVVYRAEDRLMKAGPIDPVDRVPNPPSRETPSAESKYR